MISADDLKSDEEKIAEAARRSGLFKRARRVRIYGSLAGGAFALYFIYGYLGDTQPWVWDYAVPMLTFVFLAAMIVGHGVESIFYRVEDLGTPLTIRERYFSDTIKAPKAQALAAPLTVAVPRLDLLRGADETRVMTSPLVEGPSVFVSAGGHAGGQPEKLPVGVVMFTQAGVAFLPDAEPDSAHALQEVRGAAWELAKHLVRGLGMLDALGIGDRPPRDEPLPMWAAKSFAHPEHFVLPWPELVEVLVRPANAGHDAHARA